MFGKTLDLIVWLLTILVIILQSYSVVLAGGYLLNILICVLMGVPSKEIAAALGSFKTLWFILSACLTTAGALYSIFGPIIEEEVKRMTRRA